MWALALKAFGFVRGRVSRVPWVVAALAVRWALWERADYYDCQAARSSSEAEAEKAARRFNEEDHARAVQLVGQYAGEIAELQRKYEDAQIKLARAKGGACGAGDAGRAFDDGVRALERGAGGGDAAAAGGAHTPLPKAAAPSSRRL